MTDIVENLSRLIKGACAFVDELVFKPVGFT